MTIIRLDKTRIEVLPKDLDKDGNIGGVERLREDDEDIIPMKQSSELGDSLDIAFSDKFDAVQRVSDIDMKASLHPVQIPYVVIYDTLCKMSFLSVSGLSLSRQVKRLSVSEKSKSMGIGRKNIVDMVTGKREFDRDTSEKAKTMMVGEAKR